MRFSSHCANDVSTFIVSRCSLLPPDCIQNTIGRTTVYRDDFQINLWMCLWIGHAPMAQASMTTRIQSPGNSAHEHEEMKNVSRFAIPALGETNPIEWVERLVIYTIRWWWLSDLAILSGHRAIICSLYFSLRPRNQIKIQSMDSPSFLPIDYPIWKYFRCHT